MQRMSQAPCANALLPQKLAWDFDPVPVAGMAWSQADHTYCVSAALTNLIEMLHKLEKPSSSDHYICWWQGATIRMQR